MNQVFTSKISWWLFGPVLLLLAGLGGVGLWQRQWAVGPLLLGPILFIVYLLRTTHYTVSASGLDIVCGPLRLHVPGQSITRIRPTHNPLSSPALSLDRLEIRYGKYDSVLVSPADKAGFLAALFELNPAIGHD